jgi:hypothetical protein
MATTTKRASRSTRGDRGGSSRSARTPRSGRSGSSGGRAQPPRITARNLRGSDRGWLESRAAQLSPSTLRAKWIHSPDEHEDRPGQTLATREPDVIRAWAEQRDGQPATVARRDGERPRTLRFDFGASGDGRRSSRLEPVSWEDWLATYQERELVFLFQEHRRNGDDSNFFRLDSPEREEG